MNLKDYQQYFKRVPTRYNDTYFLCRGEVLAPTEEEREFQYNNPKSCFYKEWVGKYFHKVKDVFGRRITTSDVIILTNRGERNPVLFKMIGNNRTVVFLQSLERPEFRMRVMNYSCMVITNQISDNMARAKMKTEIVKEKGKFKIVEKID